ncbi:MAG: rane protein of uknown function [Pseudonocardiales bacterium]|nr:rane protein of uknown function [Pseudonocardiales bacterium]
MFDDEHGTRRIELLLGRLAAQSAFTLRDGRVLAWPTEVARPVARRIYSVPLTNALDDIVWGLVLGRVFYGAPVSVGEPLAAVGIDQYLIDRLHEFMAPGRSGLIAAGEDERIEQLVEALAPHQAVFGPVGRE